jgi:hypothetical protein
MKWMSVVGGGIRGTTVDAKFGELLLQEIENASFVFNTLLTTHRTSSVFFILSIKVFFISILLNTN